MNNKGKTSVIITVIIILIAVIFIISAAIFANGIPSKMAVNGSFSPIYKVNDDNSSVTLKFDALKGQYQKVAESGNVLVEGKFEVLDNIIKISDIKSANTDSTCETYYIDGDTIYPNSYMSLEEVPDGNTFDGKATFNISTFTFEFTFNSDGTYNQLASYSALSDKIPSHGTYTRDGDYVKLVSSDNELSFIFLISNNKFIFKAYTKVQ